MRSIPKNKGWFDPQRDNQSVEQTGFVDLVKSFAAKSIPSDLMLDEASFNGIEDPQSILGKPSDIFDGIQMRETISNYSAPSNNEDGV